METAYKYNNWWLDNANMVYLQNGILLGYKNEIMELSNKWLFL